MISKELFKLTKQEDKIRKLWKILFWLEIGAEVFCFIVLFATILLMLIGVQKLNSPVVGKMGWVFGFVLFFAVLNFVVAYIIYRVAYKKDSLWVLRIFTYLRMAKCAYTLVVNIISLPLLGLAGLLSLASAENYLRNSALKITLLVFLILPILLFVIRCISCYFYFNLIRINKKKRCNYYLNDDSLDKLNLFLKMEDGQERNQLYDDLNNQLPLTSWLIKRVYYRDVNLIRHG